MPTLKVSKFSCIDSAELELQRMTILIGPQASGKSVLSKLLYFFNNILYRQFSALTDGKSYEAFIDGLGLEFRKWFPPSAWGEARFQIMFDAGPFTVKLQRGIARKGKQSEKIKITLSEYFINEYNKVLSTIRAAQSSSTNQNDLLRPGGLDAIWRLQSAAQKQLEKDLGVDYVGSQLFIPAGRSFFTSIGKAVAAFEQGGLLDPLTVSFGRLFASLRERGQHFYYLHEQPKNVAFTRTLAQQLFSGEIKFERDNEYVASLDGRKIPFSALSSGQQELLPLWLTLDYYGSINQERNLVYIEEPEAHLFPTAQSILVEYLASLVATSGPPKQYMLITTHSPYMLAKVNNLLKAGALGQKSKIVQEKVNSVIRREAWLRARYTRCYAIIDRKLISIIGDDGLIAADYLDDVSSAISEEFLSLLAIETER